MARSMAKDIETWENEGGAARPPLTVFRASMIGTVNQLEWVERISCQVNAGFDRVAVSLRAVPAFRMRLIVLRPKP